MIRITIPTIVPMPKTGGRNSRWRDENVAG